MLSAVLPFGGGLAGRAPGAVAFMACANPAMQTRLNRTMGTSEIYKLGECAASRLLTTKILVFETVDMLRITRDGQYCSASWGLPW